MEKGKNMILKDYDFMMQKDRDTFEKYVNDNTKLIVNDVWASYATMKPSSYSVADLKFHYYMVLELIRRRAPIVDAENRLNELEIELYKLRSAKRLNHKKPSSQYNIFLTWVIHISTYD